MLICCVNRVSASTILIEVQVRNNFDKSLRNFGEDNFWDSLRGTRSRIVDDVKWTIFLVSNYLVSLGSVSVARDSLGAQLVSRFFGENGAVVLMAPWFGLVWLGYGGDVWWEGVVGSHGGDGSFAKIHTSGVYGDDFGSLASMDSKMMVNGAKVQFDVMMFTSKEWWLMYICDYCSIVARRFAEMCTRGAHCGNGVDGSMLAGELLNECIDRLVVYPLGDVAGVIDVLDLYIVAEMRTKGVHCDEFRLDRDVVHIDADWIFLDGGALEASESHLRAVRTPAHFLRLQWEINVLDLYIVAMMRTKGVHCDELSLDRDAVHIAADCIFSDGGAPEAPESHLRAVRTPALFLRMNRETAVPRQRDSCAAAIGAGVAIGAKAATVAGGYSLVALWMLGVYRMLVCYGSMGIYT